MSKSKPIRVLYMEDDFALACIVEKSLKEAGYSVDIAQDGEEGLAMYYSGSYDILAVDQIMPGFNGLEVIRNLASQGPLPPLIMIVTGAGNEKTAIEAINLGAKDYIVKDAEGKFLELLPTVIEKTLSKQRLLDQNSRVVDALRKSEKKYRMLFELANDAFLTVILPNGKVLDANQAAVKMLGYTKEEFEKLTIWRIFAQETIVNVSQEWKTQFADKGYFSLETVWVRKDGSYVPVAVSGGALNLDGEIQFQLIGRDITERKKAEEERKELIKKLKDALSKFKL